jgi:hypothetical protein
MHLLEERINFSRCSKGFSWLWGCFEYKARVLKFVKTKKGLQYLEAKQLGLLFQVVEVQNHIASRILLAIH